MRYKKDYGLTDEQLDDKYNPDGGGEHPGYPRDQWRLAVHDKDTISGYWVWVVHMLACEEEKPL